MKTTLFCIEVAVALLVCSCATERDWLTAPPPRSASMQARVDSAARANGIIAKKITFMGPVTFTAQIGQNLTSTSTATATNNTKAGQRGGAAATAPGATATATTKKGPPWWVYALIAVLGAVGWEWLRTYLSPLKWWPSGFGR